tara:strand:+ start:40 stop:417 length:378 start_codon:yes stop_codon:yes gene_type:complete
MGVNSTDTAYSMGQMGSIFVTGTNTCSANGVTADVPASNIRAVGADAVFVAITFVEETTFASSNTVGLIPELEERHMSSTGLSKDIDNNAGSVTDGVVFPEGMTIYGRWTKFQLASGKVIAYIGY